MEVIIKNKIAFIFFFFVSAEIKTLTIGGAITLNCSEGS